MLPWGWRLEHPGIWEAGQGRVPHPMETQPREGSIGDSVFPLSHEASKTVGWQNALEREACKCIQWDEQTSLIELLFIYLFILAATGLRCCARAFSSCCERRLLFVVVRGLLIAVASFVAEHGL